MEAAVKPSKAVTCFDGVPRTPIQSLFSPFFFKVDHNLFGFQLTTE